MMMRFRILLAFVALSALLFAGCENFITAALFTTNVGAEIGLGQPGDVELSDADAIIDELSNSDLFLDGITDEEADQAVETLEATIQEDPDDPGAPLVNTPEEQEAALAIATIELASSGGDDVVTNVNNLVGDLVSSMLSGDGDNPDAEPNLIDQMSEADNPLEVIIPELFGEFDPADPDAAAAVEEQITGLLDAAQALAIYGESLDVLDPSDSVNSGDLATTALISGAVAMMVDIHPSGDDTQAIADLAEFILLSSDPDNTDLADNPFAGGADADPIEFPEFNEDDPIAGIMGDNVGLVNVLEAGAGDIAALMDSFGGSEGEAL